MLARVLTLRFAPAQEVFDDSPLRPGRRWPKTASVAGLPRVLRLRGCWIRFWILSD